MSSLKIKPYSLPGSPNLISHLASGTDWVQVTAGDSPPSSRRWRLSIGRVSSGSGEKWRREQQRRASSVDLRRRGLPTASDLRRRLLVVLLPRSASLTSFESGTTIGESTGEDEPGPGEDEDAAGNRCGRR
nr:hypothetical protein Iba_scaffold14241CG0030 [Ipomoea batatas]GME17313.1 hypothetical protein Iba_scaffold18518CG0010 [Ipomoea batatas]GME20296.1 hypothetical protein Iba_scaffold24762CG0080 [Ipomoea batatas]